MGEHHHDSANNVSGHVSQRIFIELKGLCSGGLSESFKEENCLGLGKDCDKQCKIGRHSKVRVQWCPGCLTLQIFLG